MKNISRDLEEKINNKLTTKGKIKNKINKMIL